MNDTKQKIIDATMFLIRDKGYVASTTKDIAKLAGVNECTIFRYFKGKKDIIISGMEQEKWRGNITPSLFENITWDLQTDLEMYMQCYLDNITTDFVKLSIGLRAPQIYDEVAPLIMKIPSAFVTSLTSYFEKMEQKGLINSTNYENLAMTVFSATFGYTFLKASFEDKLSKLSQKDYIKESAALFAKGIQQNK